MKIIKKLIVISSLILFSQSAFASNGRLNSEGCHTNKKTAKYHCHEKTGKAKKDNKSGKKLVKNKTNKEAKEVKDNNEIQE